MSSRKLAKVDRNLRKVLKSTMKNDEHDEMRHTEAMDLISAPGVDFGTIDVCFFIRWMMLPGICLFSNELLRSGVSTISVSTWETNCIWTKMAMPYCFDFRSFFNRKSPFLIGKPSINGPFSTANF